MSMMWSIHGCDKVKTFKTKNFNMTNNSMNCGLLQKNINILSNFVLSLKNYD